MISTTTKTSGSSRARRLSAAALVVGTALAATLTSAADPLTEPQQFVRALTDRALAILSNDSLSPEVKAERLETELGDCCDFATTAKLVLARNWKKFSAEQQQEFVRIFRDYLVATYRTNIDSYSGETAEIIGGRKEARGDYTVKTRIVQSGQNEVLVDYRLRKGASAEWRIIDIIAEGISLVSNLRSQFQEIYSSRGADGLIEAMRDKIAEPA